MDLNKLYNKQAELDKHILEKQNIKMSKEELLDNTILALLVEIGELANTTRCFKHWSKKGMMDKEVVLDELADVWHFYLSIGNQLGLKGDLSWTFNYYQHEELVDVANNTSSTKMLIEIYKKTIEMKEDESMYKYLGNWVYTFGYSLGFADKEVEQAYLKKHEENYKRQREGY